MSNRRLRNTSGGYFVVDASDRWMTGVQYFDIPAIAGTLVLLASDGFYRLVDTYSVIDENAIIEMARRDGLAKLAGRLRQIEASDYQCQRYPRLKQSDDASAILVEVVNFVGV